jgi:hypothetical protein
MHHPHNHHNIDSRSRSNGNNGRNTTTAYSTHDFSSLCDMNIFDIRYIFRFFLLLPFPFVVRHQIVMQNPTASPLLALSWVYVRDAWSLCFLLACCALLLSYRHSTVILNVDAYGHHPPKQLYLEYSNIVFQRVEP